MTEDMDGTAEGRRLRDADVDGVPWRRFGPYLSERQWGTVREDYSADGDAWDYFPTIRPAHAPTAGERTASRGSATTASALFRAGAVERQRPHPQGAAVRAHERRGQPRRGRQGILLLPRQHADPFVHEVALQVSAGRLSLRRSRRRRTGAADASWNTNSSTPESSTRTDTSMSSSNTPRPTPRTSSFGSRSHNRGPEARRLHVLPTLWFRNTWSWRHDRAAAVPPTTPGGASAIVTHARPSWVIYRCIASEPTCSSPRTRPTARGSSAGTIGRRSSKTESMTSSSAAKATP